MRCATVTREGKINFNKLGRGHDGLISRVVDGSEEANKTQGRSIEASGCARRTFSDRAVDSSVQRAQHDRDGAHIWFGALGLVCGETNFLKHRHPD